MHFFRFARKLALFSASIPQKHKYELWQNRCFFNDTTACCRYLTVDAYLDAEDFYSKCDFRPLVIPEPEDETVLMFFDIKGITRKHV